MRGYEPNLSMVADLLRNLKRPNEKKASPVEKLFKQLEKAMPGNYACRQWELFNSNFEAETRTSVLAIVATQYSIFDHEAVTNLIKSDTMNMDTWNTEKTAVFVAISETNKAYSFLVSTFFTVVFDQLTHQVDAIIQGQKKGYGPEDLLHVQFIFDEFANCGKSLILMRCYLLSGVVRCPSRLLSKRSVSWIVSMGYLPESQLSIIVRPCYFWGLTMKIL